MWRERGAACYVDTAGLLYLTCGKLGAVSYVETVGRFSLHAENGVVYFILREFRVAFPVGNAGASFYVENAGTVSYVEGPGHSGATASLLGGAWRSILPAKAGCCSLHGMSGALHFTWTCRIQNSDTPTDEKERGGHDEAGQLGGAGRGRAERCALGMTSRVRPLRHRKYVSWTSLHKHGQSKSHVNRMGEYDERLTGSLSAGLRPLFVPGC